MYKKRVRIFGPSSFNSASLQSGEGWSSLFGKIAKFGSKIARKVVPAASKGLAKIGKSKIVSGKVEHFRE